MMESKTVTDIQSFIETFPKETQSLLQQVRETIQKAAPDATEKLNYGIPTFYLNGNLVHFSGYKNHIGFYPGPTGIKAFEKELSVYKSAKGSVQFPINQPLPLDLITEITKMRVIQNIEKLKTKAKKKSNESLFPNLSSPAQRALADKSIDSLEKLATYTQQELLAMHGIGPSSIPKLKNMLLEKGLDLRK